MAAWKAGHPAHQSSLPHPPWRAVTQVSWFHLQSHCHAPRCLQGAHIHALALVSHCFTLLLRHDVFADCHYSRCSWHGVMKCFCCVLSGIQDGYVFRIQVAYHREPQILRQTIGPDGMLCYRDNDEAQALELETVHRPYLTSTLHGCSPLYTQLHGLAEPLRCPAVLKTRALARSRQPLIFPVPIFVVQAPAAAPGLWGDVSTGQTLVGCPAFQWRGQRGCRWPACGVALLAACPLFCPRVRLPLPPLITLPVDLGYREFGVLYFAH